jgi:hypothetical protein
MNTYTHTYSLSLSHTHITHTDTHTDTDTDTDTPGTECRFLCPNAPLCPSRALRIYTQACKYR